MLLTAASDASPSAGSLALIVCFGGLSLAFGIAHYRGWHKRWIRLLPFEANFFLPAWFGAVGVLLFLCELAGHVSPVLEVVIALPMFVSFVIMLMSLVWLPSRLLPSWYLSWRAHGRPLSELRS